MFHEIIRSDLEAQVISAQRDYVADVGADGKRPRVSLLGGPVVRDGWVDLAIPSAVEIVADLRLQIGLIDAAPVMRARKRHELVGQDAVEPRTAIVDEAGGGAGRPFSTSQIGARSGRCLKDRADPPNPLTGSFGRQEDRSLQVG